ncbi:hypothetical protein [Nocardia concava]|uniref:hypothetical protein n=1 Tax=Nocardia concava TaxID=257281 RepID=UPI00030C5DCD|nr:hypothetical protein [Nocardia concava]
MVRKTPQEKKLLSYTKDRRNNYGENDKSSRKAIRQNKRLPNRADRRNSRQLMATATGPVDPEASESAETTLRATRSTFAKRGWRKDPDTPLADMVIQKLRRRAARDLNSPTITAAISRIHRTTH